MLMQYPAGRMVKSAVQNFLELPNKMDGSSGLSKMGSAQNLPESGMEEAVQVVLRETHLLHAHLQHARG
jgi:hypothetical protein